jgi:hypothetical protein
MFTLTSHDSFEQPTIENGLTDIEIISGDYTVFADLDLSKWDNGRHPHDPEYDEQKTVIVLDIEVMHKDGMFLQADQIATKQIEKYIEDNIKF